MKKLILLGIATIFVAMVNVGCTGSYVTETATLDSGTEVQSGVNTFRDHEHAATAMVTEMRKPGCSNHAHIVTTYANDSLPKQVTLAVARGTGEAAVGGYFYAESQKNRRPNQTHISSGNSSAGAYSGSWAEARQIQQQKQGQQQQQQQQ